MVTVAFSLITVGRGYPIIILVLQLLSDQIPEYLWVKYEDLPGILEGQSYLGYLEDLVHPRKLIKDLRVVVGNGKHK